MATWETYDRDGNVVDVRQIPDPPTPDADAEAEALIAAARADLAAATTIAQIRTRTLALDALRALYPTVI